MPTAALPDNPILIPDPADIRAAIDATDERARLLRRLLRVSLRLQTPTATAGRSGMPSVAAPAILAGGK